MNGTANTTLQGLYLMLQKAMGWTVFFDNPLKVYLVSDFFSTGNNITTDDVNAVDTFILPGQDLDSFFNASLSSLRQWEADAFSDPIPFVSQPGSNYPQTANGFMIVTINGTNEPIYFWDWLPFPMVFNSPGDSMNLTLQGTVILQQD